MSQSDCLLLLCFPFVFSKIILLIKISFAVKSKHIKDCIPHKVIAGVAAEMGHQIVLLKS